MKKDGEKFVTAGGRVLCVTAIGDTKEDARREVYKNLENVNFAKMHYRKDIGK
jgi:phosphoribosylamine-glycine ligase